MVASIAFVVAFAMAAMSTANLNFAQHYAGARDAQYLAESAIARAIYEIDDSSSWGTLGTEQIVVQPDPSDDRRKATVTFNPSATIPYSTNNIAGDHGTGWHQSVIPASSARLVATGTSRGVTATVDVLLSAPQFPYVVACDGPLQTNGALIVKGATCMADFADQVSGKSHAVAANLGCNSGVSTTQAAQISGDVVAAGVVNLAQGSTVGGVVRNGTVSIPRIDPTLWDPTGKAGATLVTGASAFDSVSGLDYTSGDIVINGNVTMAGGLLYVKGNLTINGGLNGSGLVVATGNTILNGGADLAATNLVALVSVGNITISGSPSTPKYFQGLTYTQGSLTATNVTIAGTLIAGGANLGGTPGSGGGMSLTNVTTVYTPEASAVQVTVPTPANPAWLPGNCQQASLSTAVRDSYEFFPPIVNGIAPAGLYAALTSTYDAGGTGTMRPYPGAPFGMTTADNNLGVVRVKNAKVTLYVQVSGLWFDPVAGRYVAGSAASASIVNPDDASYVPNATNRAMGGLGDPTSGGLVAIFWEKPDASLGWLSSLGEAQQMLDDNGVKADVNDMVNFAFNVQKKCADLANQQLVPTLPPGTTTLDVTVNKFLRDTTPFRIVSWKVR